MRVGRSQVFQAVGPSVDLPDQSSSNELHISKASTDSSMQNLTMEKVSQKAVIFASSSSPAIASRGKQNTIPTMSLDDALALSFQPQRLPISSTLFKEIHFAFSDSFDDKRRTGLINMIRTHSGEYVDNLEESFQQLQYFIVPSVYDHEKYPINLPPTVTVVRQSWIDECISQNRLLPCEGFVIPQVKTPQGNITDEKEMDSAVLDIDTWWKSGGAINMLQKSKKLTAPRTNIPYICSNSYLKIRRNQEEKLKKNQHAPIWSTPIKATVPKQLFYGIVFWVDGFTAEEMASIRLVVVGHGGVIQEYSKHRSFAAGLKHYMLVPFNSYLIISLKATCIEHLKLTRCLL